MGFVLLILVELPVGFVEPYVELPLDDAEYVDIAIWVE